MKSKRTRRFARWVGSALALMVGLGMGTASTAAEKQPLNVLFFLVDDLGYMDVGCNNPDTFYETPHIDHLAQTGMRFTDGYAASPVCSPTRYSIMAGKYPSRVDATDWFSGKRAGRFLPAPLNDKMPLSEVTVAEALKSRGYATLATARRLPRHVDRILFMAVPPEA